MVEIAKERAALTEAQLNDPQIWGSIGNAYTLKSENHQQAWVRRMWYKFEFPTSPLVSYTVRWTEVTIYLDGGISTVSKQWQTTGTGAVVVSPRYELSLPCEDAIKYITDARVCPDGAVDNCNGPNSMAIASGEPGCCGSEQTGGGVSLQGGVNLTIPLGLTGYGKSAGSVRFHTPQGSSKSATAGSLEVVGPAPDTEVINDTAGALRQARSRQYLAHVRTVSASSLVVHIFPASQIALTKVNGLFVTNGATEVAVWLVTAPLASGGNYDQINISEILGPSSNPLIKTSQFSYSPGNKSWTLLAPDAASKQRESSVWDSMTKTLTVIRDRLDPLTDQIVYRDSQVWSVPQAANGGVAYVNPIESRVGVGTEEVSTSYTYENWKIKLEQHPSGRWTKYTWSGQRLASRSESFGSHTYADFQNDPNLCRRTEYSYDTEDYDNDDGSLWPELARSETEYVEGVAVRQTKRVVHRLASPAIVDWIKVYLLPYEGAPLTDPAALVTTTDFYTTGTFAGRVKSVLYPDQTMAFYSYVDTATDLTTTVYRGQPNGAKTALVAGSKQTTVVSRDGRLLSSTTRDFESNLVVEQRTYSNFDSRGRAQTLTYLDGTTELYSYSCCLLDSFTARDGTVTTYGYDSLKRRISETTVGITHWTDYDAAGYVWRTRRQGTDGSIITLNLNHYNSAGELDSSTDQRGATTTYTESWIGGVRTRTTTEAVGLPEELTRIESYFPDGQLKETSGNGESPTRYAYGILTDGVFQVPYRLTVKLTVAGTTTGTNEWSATLTDFLGRSYKTIYSDNTPGTLADNAANTSYYDNQGRVVRSVDPDGITTLYSRPNLTNAVTAVDMNLNGLIDYSGTDRISKTVSEVAPAYGTTVRRTTTYEYTFMNNGTPVVTGVSEVSADGLRSWQTTVGVGNPSATVTQYPGGGYRNVTTTAPDGSYTLNIFLNGRLQSSTQRLSTGTQIGAVSYIYDAHGRQWKVTDARNGSTVVTYDNADQVRAVTTPPPGNGQPAQTTQTEYDNLGRVKQVTRPDGTVTLSDYYPTGLLKRSWGSQTYPVEYAYDGQGRLKTQKTYRNFSGNWVSPGTADTTTWNYDEYRGWLNNKRFADNRGPDYTYLPSGRLQKRQWARGSPRVEAVWTYNKAGDVETLTYNNDSSLTPDITYGYDRHGCQTTVSSVALGGTWSVNRTFDLQHNPLTESYAGTHPLAGRTTTLTYDSLLRRSTFSLDSSPAALGYSLGYDGASRLTNVSDGTYSATYTYLANSPLAESVTMKQGTTTRLVTTRSYDFLNRLQGVTAQPQLGGSLPLGTGYQYNDVNQRTRQMFADGSVRVYTYDSLGQVVSGKQYFGDGSPVPGQQFEYTFDTIGNRSNAKRGGDADGANLRLETYGVNSLNQYSSRSSSGSRYADILGLAAASSSVTVNGTTAWRRGEYFRHELTISGGAPAWQNVDVTTSGGGSATGRKLYVPPTPESFTYDFDGNLTGDGRWTYTWDAENRLVQMDTVAAAYVAGVPGQRLQCDYDDQGRRIRKRVSNGNNSTYTMVSDVRFVLDGWNVVAELNGLSANALLQSYLWGSDLSGSLEGAGGVGGLVFVKPVGGDAQFAAYDGSGNVIGLVDGASGATTANYDYSTFGETLRMTGPRAAANPFRFSTKAAETESGLLYFGYRYYQPTLGRWISRDPSGEHDDDSMYSFVGNHPANAVDPNGLYQIDFHFYIIQYLFLASGYGPDSKAIANWSQHVDNDPLTDPIRLGMHGFWSPTGDYDLLRMYHFPGSTRFLGTPIAESQALNALQYSLSMLRGNNESDLLTLGANLHTFADTFAHNGFSADQTRFVNSLEVHPEWRHYTKPQLPLIGHGPFGSRPDYPFLRPNLALNAAQAIYAMIPVGSYAYCGRKLPWDEIRGTLSSLLRKKGSEVGRSRNVYSATINAFGPDHVAWYYSHEYQKTIDE
ncbi:MAG: RHS repeat-associated core domain-containing protein [Verrucomicrobia bacterium]|nr:RHS repeat-associated core domain-containing protein [Verrucomicrobiota bacterium]